ncbi:hypothetical protein PGT21_004912 [Puccinia graminis f. sp. tritici]|uniref:Copper/zinc superoxide dismutase n=2 Tax=Puccinia graminis f. sp. tritici TaxID=56615 RepID=E3KB69_PUCGT|nr:copper/zinc superoxide dismutase [Puccinia graminis f. sp. tritici CRL 75-36-700-3]KAA1074271.1 hypothetical protein PGTUg99_032711 [Puccinia graminis f. sp. tritici]EFP81582.1 copper/zinc superoxide dismutase [Puccinia graminis f. sp. tritici CRL 75-36-700-3]KAA1090509.1 hypothetical protein PGT21_003703 [Puccinia graminis f. sp. tritici]KAA1100483.1 hypothetical protein PGTUg99_011234 [Puccinia graminis f. sp. tritici]KAA1109965.1 hypothetical protein PGT21_004912 [Puccinia graminis f. sp
MNPPTIKLVHFLGLLLFIFAYVPAIVRAAGRAQPTCPKGYSAQVIGIQGITGKVTFKPTTAGIEVTVVANGFERMEKHKCHIHVNRIQGGNCYTAGANYDLNSKQPNCPLRTPQDQCQTGDLTGKGGDLEPKKPGVEVSMRYTDKILKVQDLVGHSVVFHDQGGDFIGCGNIECVTR